MRKLAKSCSLSRKRAGMREKKEIFDNLCFSMSLFRAAGSNLCPPLPGAWPDLAVSAGGSLAGARGRKMERGGVFQRKPKQNRENPESCSLCHKRSSFMVFYQEVNYSHNVWLLLKDSVWLLCQEGLQGPAYQYLHILLLKTSLTKAL